jgi:hypothetical protein
VSLPALLLFAATLPGMSHGAAHVHSGVVVAAPHEGFDDHTAPIAREIARNLGTGWVVAKNYRKTRERRWFDVNRPTQRAWTREGGRGRARVTEAGREVYAEYQRRVDKASSRTPLGLLVEIHGHNRKGSLDGRRARMRVIELATIGFDEEQLVALRKHFRELVQALPPGDRVVLAVEQLDRTYTTPRGMEGQFYFGASGSKRAGSMSPKRSARALHFECPQHVRFDPRRRARYTKLFTELLRPLVKKYAK